MAEQILPNDRELLEMAAKACGITLIPYTWNKGTGWDHEGFTEAGKGPDEWNPLEDDGSALRLAVKLRLQLIQMDSKSEDDGITTLTPILHVDSTAGRIYQYLGDDPCAATRRAIVRAAASIGALK